MAPVPALPVVALVPPAPSHASPSAEERPSPQSDGTDDDSFDGDQDDAHSVMQPAISRLATLLTSPNTPAADKAAAFDRQSGGALLEGVLEGDGPDGAHREEPAADGTGSAAAGVATHQFSASPLPSPFLVTEPDRFKASISAALPTRSRHSRSLSVGESALKKLSRALPSLSIPSGLIPTIPTPTFFSSGSGSPQKEERASQHRTPPTFTLPENSSVIPDSARPRSLRHSASDDSLLYHTLSRVSSLGDNEERFAHVREQVNVRIKAIMDSFDSPSFKLPQMPSRSPLTCRPPNGAVG